MSDVEQIRVGDFVVVEQTRGWASDMPITLTHAGVAYVDDEGTTRVDGVNVTRDSAGYFAAGVLVVSIEHR